MNDMRLARMLGGGCLTLAFVAGCSGKFDARVAGEASLDGSPLSSGTITFTPTAEGPKAVAKIDPMGRYRVRVGREYGLPPGEYRVSVVSREPAAAAAGRDGGPPPAGALITPEWYRSISTSGLAYNVEPGSNEINLELTSSPPPGWRPNKSRRR